MLRFGGAEVSLPDGCPAGDGRRGDGDQRSQDQGCRFARLEDVQARAHGRCRDRDTELRGRQRAQAQWLSREPGQRMAEHGADSEQQSQKDQPRPGPERAQVQGRAQPDEEQGAEEPSVTANS